MNLGLYIHIPFCRSKCLYCDFPSRAGAEPLYASYTTALCREIAGRGGLYAGGPVDSIYFGGGTPTVLPGEQLASVVATLRQYWPIIPTTEFTVEANPGTLDRERLAVLRSSGVNRLSIGVQAFDDAVLAGAGRIHSAAEAAEAVIAAATAGFQNISVDLMYGLPGQTGGSFRQSLETATALPVRHISVYGLKVEEGTPFARRLAVGELALPDEDEEAAMYEYATQYLPTSGFGRYEISNYARNGFACRHNLKYWRYEPYIGLGAAAHSFWQGERTANTADIEAYIGRLAAGQSPTVSRERAVGPDAMAEYAFLALRTAEGLLINDFTDRFGHSPLEYYVVPLQKFHAQGLVEIDDRRIRLTATGMKYGNVVFAAFLPDKP